MKTTVYKFRKAISFFGIALTASLIMASCKKENKTEDQVTDEELTEMVTQSVSPASGGLALQMDNAVQLAVKNNLTCGATKDTTIVKTNTSGMYSYTYTLNATKALVCTGNVPTTLNFSFTGTSVYATPKMSSDDKSNAQIAVTGLPSNSINYVINGTYVRIGTQQAKVRLQRSIASTITITGTNITINKATLKAVSGTATIQIVATTSGGKAIDTTAVITFLGNNTASLTLKSGKVISLQW